MEQSVLYIGAVQSLFAGIVIASKRPQLIADRYLAAWLFIIAFEMILALVKVNFLNYLPYQLPFLVVPFVYGPLLFLYVSTLISEDPKFRPWDLLHFLPFLILFIIAFFFKDIKGQENPSVPFPDDNPSWFARSMYNILIFTSITVYTFLVLVLFMKHRKRIKEQFSFKSGRITLSWLFFITLTIYFSYFLSFVVSGINIFVIKVPFDPRVFTYIGLTLFSFAFSFYGYRQAGIYNRYPEGFPSMLSTQSEDPVKYAKSGLSDATLAALVRKLDESMEKDKLYLQPELSLADVAKHLKVSRHHLTQALNIRLGKNFYTYINEYRVKTVITNLKNPENKNFTVLAIALDSGFNSKSTFNSVFKKITGFTPSDFLNSLEGTD